MIDTERPLQFIGLCHECVSIKIFSDERERDLWEKFHPHQENT